MCDQIISMQVFYEINLWLPIRIPYYKQQIGPVIRKKRLLFFMYLNMPNLIVYKFILKLFKYCIKILQLLTLLRFSLAMPSGTDKIVLHWHNYIYMQALLDLYIFPHQMGFWSASLPTKTLVILHALYECWHFCCKAIELNQYCSTSPQTLWKSPDITWYKQIRLLFTVESLEFMVAQF